MEKAFGDGYYDEEEKERDLEKAPKTEDLEIPSPKAINIPEPEPEQGYDTWYCCDGCFQPIKPGKHRFDCKTCDNFTFCKTCFKANETHAHEFKKVKIPASNAPPPNST